MQFAPPSSDLGRGAIVAIQWCAIANDRDACTDASKLLQSFLSAMRLGRLALVQCETSIRRYDFPPEARANIVTDTR